MKPIYAGEQTAEDIYGDAIHWDCPRYTETAELQQQQAAD
jgi:hypothetical protein